MPVDELMELGQVEDHQRVRLVGCTGIFCDPKPSLLPKTCLSSNFGIRKAASNGLNKQNFQQHTSICRRKNRWRSSRQRDNRRSRQHRKSQFSQTSCAYN
ncbi:hypothetical protein DPMN_136815 [Dreissena polymorpha]|uniref:Uncharacterized protein n=1 Tax=Dreissena polymorpha TaxID=45954 RepID=A0A9D4JFW4_DREPO|nr:hypothetical protein DPMN_136815 [Dreissena polymorpha]